jgi:hypothetical protein
MCEWCECAHVVQVFCVFPFVENFMMRTSFFDDEGTVHAHGFPGTMLVSMEFDDREEEVTNDNGETETVVAHFNKVICVCVCVCVCALACACAYVLRAWCRCALRRSR